MELTSREKWIKSLKTGLFMLIPTFILILIANFFFFFDNVVSKNLWGEIIYMSFMPTIRIVMILFLARRVSLSRKPKFTFLLLLPAILLILLWIWTFVAPAGEEGMGGLIVLIFPFSIILILMSFIIIPIFYFHDKPDKNSRFIPEERTSEDI
jgi:hypothetical protein